jgi:DNA repair protein RadA/Sms
VPATRTSYFCTECGNETARWSGQCPSCHAWNTLAEAPAASGRGGGSRRRGAGGRSAGAAAPVAAARLGDGAAGDTARWPTGIDELDFVLGGGLVPGSLTLLGGEPGVGKSTLLLQAAAALQRAGRSVLYASGEESLDQVAMRAGRLGGGAADVLFLAETSVDAVIAESDRAVPSVLVVDSIQAMRSDDVDGIAGNVGQIRECGSQLQQHAKSSGTAVVLVGHVTKDGSVAGPRTLEHIVDTVLYFEGARGGEHRLLRAAKNRFGSAREIGVFRMTPAGLEGVADPSELLLGERSRSAPGAAVTVTIEGTRPLLVEVQALCGDAAFGSPQRVSTGFDPRRLALLLAVLEKRAGVAFARQDVFLNVTGGVRLSETAADLAVCAALLSSLRGRALPLDAVYIGEVGLTGEVRAVSALDRRLGEAARHGFRSALVPQGRALDPAAAGLRATAIADIAELADRAVP